MPSSCSSHSVDTPSGDLKVHTWEPQSSGTDGLSDVTVVTVHPWATLGGGEQNCIGVAKRLARSGLRTITFQLRASFAVWGIVTSHSSEVKQIDSVVRWVLQQYGGRVMLFGSSAGAPFAGSAMDESDSIIGSVVVGYPFGMWASIAFSGHFKNIKNSTKPKYFIMGAKDEFTSLSTFENIVNKCTNAKGLIYDDVGHFELESPAFDSTIANNVLSFAIEILDNQNIETSIQTVDGQPHA